MGFLQSAYVIARRDFVATVFTRSFLLFLLFPLLIMGVSLLMGRAGGQMAREDLRSSVAIVAPKAEFNEINAARTRLNPAFGRDELPQLVHAEPDYVLEMQVKELLASPEKRIIAVLTGGLAQPRLTGDIGKEGLISKQLQLILDEVSEQRTLRTAGAAPPPRRALSVVQVEESAGSLATTRALTARLVQFLLFFMTVLLATMLLSNLVEEKSNKIIEVLTASIAVDAIFIGKLFAMLAASLVGIAVWVSGAAIALAVSPLGDFTLPEPAVGWPAFIPLVLLYYSSNYLLLGAVFLGLGSQANSVREVQTLSMPVSMGQMLVFLLAFVAGGRSDSFLGIAAAVFPFSSPLTMIARAAQSPELWHHLIALVWQVLWVWLTVKLSAGLFRRNVMKSGSGETGFRRAKA